MIKYMAHVDQVKNLLKEKDFPIEKIEFSTEKGNYSLLAIGNDKQMSDFRSRSKKASKTIMFIQDESPTFYPAIKGSCFEMVKVIFEYK